MPWEGKEVQGWGVDAQLALEEDGWLRRRSLGRRKGTGLADGLIYIPSFLFKTSGLFTTVFPEDSTQTEWLLSPFKTNVQHALISTSELGVQYLHGAIFPLLFPIFFIILKQNSCSYCLAFLLCPVLYLPYLLGLGASGLCL